MVSDQRMLDAEWDRATGCLLWRGPISAKHGRPIVYAHGHPVLVSRAQWAAIFGQPPSGMQLKSVCGTPSCVSPYHWAIRSPTPFMRKLGLSAALLSRLTRLLSGMVVSGEIKRVTWAGPLPALECDPEELRKLQSEVPGLPPMAALCAYAALLWKEGRDHPPSTDSTALLKLESRAALRLLERGLGSITDVAFEGEQR